VVKVSIQPDGPHAGGHNTWREWSKGHWQSDSTSGYPGDNLIIIGCLQRIADALESIAGNLDPVKRRERKGKANESREKEGRREAWREITEPVWYHLERRVTELIERGGIRRKAELVRTLRFKLFSHFFPRYWRQKQHPEKKDSEKAEWLIDQFDPLTFDWSQIPLGQKTRQKLESALENIRAYNNGD
jgi:hypothetical protein